jgi:hypothetical protein
MRTYADMVAGRSSVSPETENLAQRMMLHASIRSTCEYETVSDVHALKMQYSRSFLVSWCMRR